MVAERKERVSIEEKARILMENGIEVCQWVDQGESEFHYFPTL